MTRRCLLLFTALLLLLPLPALAEGETAPAATPSPLPAPPAESAPPQAEGASLAIDDANVYEGMAKSYGEGYVPGVKKGVATVVLPLVARGEIRGNAVAATPSLGDPSASPFVIKNYRKTVRLAENAVNGGAGAVPSYLVRFDLPLKSGRFNGAYPVTVDIEAEAADGTPVRQSFTCYVTVTDGRDPNATPKPEEPAPQPRVIVRYSGTEPAPVTAGQAFTAKVTLENVGGAPARNLTVTASTDSPALTLGEDSPTLFVGAIDGGEARDVEILYTALLDAVPQRHTISLALEYEGTAGAAYTASGSVAAQVTQSMRLQLDAPKINAQVNAGDTLPLAFQVMNLGRGKAYNVRCELAAPGLIPLGTAFIGNLEGGTAGTAEMDVFVGTKDMTEGYEGEEPYGFTSGTIRLLYEDETGKEYAEETEINTTILEPAVAPVAAEEEETPKGAGQWWIAVLCCAALTAALAAALAVRRRGRRRHAGA